MLSHRIFPVILLVILMGFLLPTHAQETTQPLFTLLGTISEVSKFEWSISENKLVVEQDTGPSKSICIWDVQNQACNTIETYDTFWSAELSPNGQQLAVGLLFTVQIIDVETRTEQVNLTDILAEGSGGGIPGIAWSNDGNYLAVGGIGVIHIFNSATWLKEKTLLLPPVEQPEQVRTPLVLRLNWSPDNEYLVAEYVPSTPTVTTLNIFQVSNGSLVYAHNHSRGGTNWVNGGEFFSHLEGDRILLIDGITFEFVREYPALNADSLSWSPNGEYLTYFLQNEERIVTLQADQVVTENIVASGMAGLEQAPAIKEISWSYDGSYLAILSRNQIYIYEVTPPQHP